MSDRTDQMRQIRDEVLNLTESPLYEYRASNGYFPVIGQGSHRASLMFIGEAPGENEAKTGMPFCGASGRVLDELIESIGMKREEVYITNIVKDRPPENRDPTSKEIEVYSPFLVRQINIIQPKVIATLGRFSMEFILKLFKMPEQTQKISQLRGKVIKGEAEFGTIHIVPLFHPAVALYERSKRAVLNEDFQVLRQFMDTQ